MNENAVQKCRTCLKSSKKTFLITKHSRGCKIPKKTYAQLLKEYVKLECSPDYEPLMPQYLCLLCSRELRNLCNFIRQAQHCNAKLINVISKKFDCLQEKTIYLPSSNENDWETPAINIKIEKDTDCIKNGTKEEPITATDKFSPENTNIHLKPELSEGSIDNENPNQNEDLEYKYNIDSDRNNTNNLTLEYSTTSATNLTTITNLIDNGEESSESQTNTICPICHKVMSRRDNLLTHMRTQHDIEAPSELLHKQKAETKEVFSCKICHGKYTNKYTYIYHLKNKHRVDERECKQKVKDKIIKCRSCDYTARTYAALNYHTRSKHGTENDKFKCKFCSYMCLKKFDLLTHVKNTHKDLIKTLKAEVENKADQGVPLNDVAFPNCYLTTSKIAKLHKNDENEENSIEEENENFTSDDNTTLAEKVTKSDAKSTLNTEVDDNDREYFSDEEFIRKILNIKKRQAKSMSTKSLARRCHECGNIYKNYKALYAHQRHVHISEDKYSLCPHCGKKYKRKPDLRNHIQKAHTPKDPNDNAKQPAKVREKRFMCTHCSYICTTITILNIHINRHHTGEKPYKCDICFKSFHVPFDLKIHRYLHTGERPYQCPICSKGFRDNSHMIKHKRIHSSERPYKCKECGKGFTQSYNLSVHKRTHLKEKKLNCAICDKVFENKMLLNLHRINENHHDEII